MTHFCVILDHPYWFKRSYRILSRNRAIIGQVLQYIIHSDYQKDQGQVR